MIYYNHDILGSMIREVEKEFPLTTSIFPTDNIYDLIANPDHPDDEGRECGEPFLNQRWIDVPAIQWYNNDEFVSFSTSRALGYFLPSIIRLSYLEEMTNGEKRYMSNAREWMMNTLTGVTHLGEVYPFWTKTTGDIYDSYTKNQLSIVRKWILFENRKNNDEFFAHALELIDRAIGRI